MIRAITVREFYVQTYRLRKLAGSPATTNQEYCGCLNHLHRFCGHDPTLGELSGDLIAAIMWDLIERGRTHATANKFLTHIRAIWAYAFQRKLATEPEHVDRLKEPKRLPKAWRDHEMARILQSAAQQPGELCGTPANFWWCALLGTLYESGLRITATMRSRWEHFDLIDRRIVVPAEVQKHGVEESHPLSEQTMEVLLRIRSPKWLFPWPYDRNIRQWNTLTRHLRKILVRAGLPTTCKDLFHKFRKTNASYIKAAGGDPTLQLGHSSPRVTEAYLDRGITGLGNQLDLLPRTPMPTFGDTQLTLF
jgi:integrase